MCDATMCPHLLLCTEDTDPLTFETTYLSAAISHFESCRENAVRLRLPSSVVQYVTNNYPWSRITEANWKGFLLDWWARLQPLLEFVSYPLEDRAAGDLPEDRPDCLASHEQIQEIWCEWLDLLAQGHTFAGRFDRGIGVCSTLHQPNVPLFSMCNQFVIVENAQDWSLVKHPWLRMYDERLPVAGDYPFAPAADWADLAGPKRAGAPSYGYMDIQGREWVWDRLHDNHWDVQQQDGSHLNVTPSGRLL